MHILINISSFFIILLFSLILVCPVAHTESKASQILKKVIENHKQFATGMSVSYHREIKTTSMAILDADLDFDKASGIFFFKGPNFLKIQQDIPSREYVISNGKSIWWYVPDKKTAERFDNVGKELSVLSKIFMGLKNPKDDFDVTITSPENIKECILILTPKGSLEEEIDYINIALAEKDYKITRIELLDITGNLTRFKLGEFEQKKDLTDSFFEFIVPDDVKVIEE